MITFNTGATANSGTGDSLRDAFNGVNSNFTEVVGYLLNKEDKSNITQDITGNLSSIVKYPSIKGITDWVNLNVQGAPFLGSIVPTDTPTGTGKAYWLATQAGTYTNFGSKVVNSNSLAVISRDALGAFTISQTAFVVADSKINLWTAKAYAIGDQVNYLGKDWTANAITVAGDVPATSTKWVERLFGYNVNTKQFTDTNYSALVTDLTTTTVTNSHIDVGGAIIANAGWRATNLIDINIYNIVNVSIIANSAVLAIAFYDIDNKFISGITGTTNSVLTYASLTYPTGTVSVRLAWQNDQAKSATIAVNINKTLLTAYTNALLNIKTVNATNFDKLLLNLDNILFTKHMRSYRYSYSFYGLDYF
jgi:hypothetical protein